MKILVKIKNRLIDKKYNKLLDRQVYVLTSKNLKNFIKVSQINFNEQEYREWIKEGQLEFQNYDFIHKKGLEFFFSYKILGINQDDYVMDAAGGKSNYLKAIQKTAKPKKVYLTDHIYEGIKERDDGVIIVGGDISSMQLKDQSLTKISCHHAFEHFQGNRDIEFISEISRLLKTNGIACIIPLFISDKYIECWNISKKTVFDKKANLIIDKSASLPGADADGHFARIYNIESLKERILNDNLNLNFEIIECLIDGTLVPDMDKNFGSKANYPLRVLKITKL